MASTMSACPPPQHASTGSSASSSSDSTGSAYQLILDHILTCPGSYEIPLRTMYALNCAPRTQSRSGSLSSSSTGSSPAQAQAPWADHQAAHTFTENLMAQIQQLPNQPASLPPSFLTSFLQKCFPRDLIYVDFPQALTGLDYLKDLETRRRREVAAAMGRLAIDRSTLDSDAERRFSRSPGVLPWVKSIEEKERKVEALYTQLYVAIRRWIMINELSLVPFNKHNCVAMLNTLYPPVVSSPPTLKLTPAVLQSQRSGFFKYIVSVEKNGPSILRNLMQQGKAPTDDNGWLAVTRTLGLYLQLAKSMIDDCSNIADIHDLAPGSDRRVKAPRKADSAISFGAFDARSARSNSAAEPISPTEPLRTASPAAASRSATALEKIARRLKTIGRSRTNATEMVTESAPQPPPAEKPRMLRRMCSMGAIEKRKNLDAADGSEAFDVDAMRTQRLKYEVNAATASKLCLKPISFEA